MLTHTTAIATKFLQHFLLIMYTTKTARLHYTTTTTTYYYGMLRLPATPYTIQKLGHITVNYNTYDHNTRDNMQTTHLNDMTG